LLETVIEALSSKLGELKQVIDATLSREAATAGDAHVDPMVETCQVRHLGRQRIFAAASGADRLRSELSAELSQACCRGGMPIEADFPDITLQDYMVVGLFS
jgi:hypothetical protein